MKATEGYAIAAKILRASGHDRDPEKIADALGIEIEDKYDLGNLKGMYSSRDRHRTVFANCRLSTYGRIIVLYHEIGHDQKHRHLAKDHPLQDIYLFSNTGRTEMEANVIAAHLLIDEEELLEYIKAGYTTEAVASILRVPEDILLIKMQEMRKCGFKEFKLPRYPDSCFLKDYDFGEDDWWEC